MKNFMFDTNIFDKLLDEKIDTKDLPKNNYFVTHVQLDEINAISKPEKQERKQKLLSLFKKISRNSLATESLVFGISRFGMAKFSKKSLIEELRKGNLRHTEDALIGETAIKNRLILVTNNTKDLLKRVNVLGGKAITFKQFLDGDFK